LAEVILIEATPLAAAGTSTVAVRMAGGGSRAYTHKGFNDWIGGVASKPRFTTALGFDASGPTGGSIPSTGNIRFSAFNAARLSQVAGYYWKGARVVISIGDDSLASPTWTVLATGTVSDIKTDGAAMLLTLADLAGDLNKTICPDTFAGTGDLEGDNEATGRTKRRSWGKCYNVELRVLDKANLIYEAGDPSKPLQGISEVRDKGLPALSTTVIAWAGSAAATLTALRAATPSPGGCATAPSIGCVKWWTTPSGPLTADILGENSAGYDERVAYIASYLIGAFSTITMASITAALGWSPGPAGLHCDDPSETVASALNRLLLPVFINWTLDAAGTFYMRQWTFASPVETLAADTIIRETVFPPTLLRSVGYQRNHRIQTDGEISAALTDAPGAWTRIVRANCFLTGASIIKNAGSSAYGNASVYSSESYFGPALSFKPAQTGKSLIIGFRSVGTTYAGYSSLTYSAELSGTTLYARYGGAQHESVTYAAGDTIQLIDDTVTVHWLKNGVEFATTPSDGLARSLDSDFNTLGGRIDDVTFASSGAAGKDGISPSLSNESVVVASASDGTGAVFTAAGGTFNLYKGGVRLATGVTYSVVSGSTSGGITISINSSTGDYTISALTGDQGGATLRATYNGVNYDKVYSIAKSKQGAGAPILTLQNTADAITIDGTGAASPSSQSITFTATPSNVSGTITWTATAYNASNTSLGSVSLSGSGSTRTLSNTQFLANGSTTAYVVVNAAIGAISDTVTIVKLVAGSDAITPNLSNESVTLAADASGNVTGGFTPAAGTFNLYKGAVRLTSGVTYSVVSSSGVTISINSSTGDYTVSAMSADTATATLRATYNSVNYDKVYSASKSRLGSPGADGLGSANRIKWSKFEFGLRGWANPFMSGGISVNTALAAQSYQGSAYIREYFNSPGSGAVATLGNNTSSHETYFRVTPGERLAVRVGVQAFGPISNVQVNAWFMDSSFASTGGAAASGASNLSNPVSGQQGFNTQIGGFVTVPAGSVWGRLEIYYTANGSGVMDCSLIEPFVCQAAAGQTVVPSFTPGQAGEDAATAGGGSTVQSTTIDIADKTWPYGVTLANGQSLDMTYQLVAAGTTGGAMTIRTWVEISQAGLNSWSTISGTDTGNQGYNTGDPLFQDGAGTFTNSSGVERAYDIRFRYSHVSGAGAVGAVDHTRSFWRNS